MRLLIGLALIMALGTAVGAAEPDKSSPPPDLEAVAAAVAEADRIIAAAEAGDLFKNITDNDVPTVRHLRSGLRCSFERGEPLNRIGVFPVSTPAVPHGDDVVCVSKVLDIHTSLYATRYPGGTTVDNEMRGAVAAIQQRYTDVRPREIKMTVNSESDSAWRKERRTAGFDAKLNGEKVFTRVTVAMHDGWAIKLRMTGPRNVADAADLLGEMQSTNWFGELETPASPPAN